LKRVEVLVAEAPDAAGRRACHRVARQQRRVGERFADELADHLRAGDGPNADEDRRDLAACVQAEELRAVGFALDRADLERRALLAERDRTFRACGLSG